MPTPLLLAAALAMSTPTPVPGAFAAAVTDTVDAVLLPAARRPPPRPTVVTATRARATPEAIRRVLLDPASYPQALPALIRADVEATRPAVAGAAAPDRLLGWELEIPLFNLEGKAWLADRGDTVELALVEGAFAPGLIRFRWTAAEGATLLTCELQMDARSGNWLTRRLARHNPFAETAMSAATGWVLARAVALRAEGAAKQAATKTPAWTAAARHPTDAIGAPPAERLDGRALGGAGLAPLRAAGTLAAVHRSPGGRLAWASVSVPIAGAAPAVATRLATPETWRAFPGWKKVRRLQAPAPDALLVEVEDDISFVDFDAVWRASWSPATRATAVRGDIRGAVLGWDVTVGDRPGTVLAVLSMHPRLDAAGFVERRLIAAEPLLEHGLALALAYADAAATAEALDPQR